MLTRLLAALFLCLTSAGATAQDRSITLASTTSTEQSGFFAYVLPLFEAETKVHVKVVAVGTGQALKLGERGDADALLVHDPAGEEKFVTEGHGLDRRPVMFNDFIIVGPKSDPAQIRGLKTAKEALSKIAAAQASFISRGDDSGTHRMELRQWKGAEVKPAGTWYRETGQGMGPTLNIAAELNGYVLTDRATWANFKNRRELEILVEGDRGLYNPYSSILVNPAKSPKIKASEAKIWHEWITTPPGQKAIESFRIDGQQVFFLPEIKKASSENMVWIPGGTFAWDLISTIRKKRRRTK
ncbi:MAG TPA: substrate-binding domain-containing protein [Aestuariivirgaceae bacterium]